MIERFLDVVSRFLRDCSNELVPGSGLQFSIFIEFRSVEFDDSTVLLLRLGWFGTLNLLAKHPEDVEDAALRYEVSSYGEKVRKVKVVLRLLSTLDHPIRPCRCLSELTQHKQSEGSGVCQQRAYVDSLVTWQSAHESGDLNDACNHD